MDNLGNLIPKSTLSRRALTVTLLGGVSAVSMGQLSGCSVGGTGTVQPTVMDIIINALIPICQVIPIIATLVDIVASVFPIAVGVSVITDAVAKQIANYICNLFKTAGVIGDDHKLLAKPGGSYKATVNDKVLSLHGWTVGPDGKLVYF